MGYFDDVKAKTGTEPANNHLTVVRTDPESGSRYAHAALRDEMRLVLEATEGFRNDTLNKAYFNLGRHVAAGSIDAETVRANLAEAARSVGLAQNEIDIVLRQDSTSALRAASDLPRHPAPLADVPTPTILNPGTDEEGVDLSSVIREKFPLIDWQELWDTEDEDEEWIIEPILPARRLVALFSAPKVGKSLLMLEIAARVAQGEMVLGVLPDRPRRVLYVDFENDPRGDVRTRLQAMGIKPHTLENLCYLSYPTLAKLDTFAGAAELMAIVAEYQCEVVVIDTISRAVAGEENENDTWLSFYRNTGLAMKQAGVACIRLDHTGKDHEKGMRGGSAKYGDVDAVWKLSKVTEDTYRLDCTDHRMRVSEDVIVLTREVQPMLRHTVAAEGRMAAWDAKVREIVTALDALDAPSDTGRETAKEMLKDTGIKARNDVFAAAVKQRRMKFGYAPQEEL